VKFKKRRPPPPFIGGARLFGKPAIQQGVALRETSNPTVRRQSTVTSKTPRNHFERGQRLRHLATSSAPDDFVELVPRRANVGAKAKTPPFARSLRCSRWSDRDKTGRDTLRLIGTRRRPATTSSHSAASSSSEAHVRSGPS
jgi:hypothetical protein